MSEDSYYLLIDDKQAGPYGWPQIEEMWNNGVIAPSTLFWTEGQTEWIPLSNTVAAPAAPTPSPIQQPAYVRPAASQAKTAKTVHVPVRRSRLAVASLICGIVGLGIPAIICGHLSLGRIKQSVNGLSGKGMAIVGLILGYLGMVVSVVAISAAFALPIFAKMALDGQDTQDLVHARRIALAIKMYEIDNNSRTPPNLDALIPKYLPDRTVFTNPFAKDSNAPGYEYLLPGANIKTITNPATAVLLRGIYKDWRGQRSYVYVNGNGEEKKD